MSHKGSEKLDCLEIIQPSMRVIFFILKKLHNLYFHGFISKTKQPSWGQRFPTSLFGKLTVTWLEAGNTHKA